MDSNVNKRRSVGIIGGGPAGLVAAQKFNLKSDLFDVTIFDKLSDVGGTWIYSESTGIDKYGLPVHSSLYQNLKTNLPTILMEFDDYPHNDNPSGFVTHQEVRRYLQGFASHFNLTKCIKFEHLVTRVSREHNSWSFQGRNLKTNETFTQSFDIVCICPGRYSDPSIPDNIPGLKDFKGNLIHTHDYRRADIFTGKRVAILGGGSSGIDIAVEVSECSEQTYWCYPFDEYGNPHRLGNKIIQPGAIFKSIGPDFIELTNGTVLQSIDAIVFATGYNINLDFIDSSCGITPAEGRVDGLFLHMINIEYPTMAFMSLIEKVPLFNIFCQMAKYWVGTLTGEAHLPSKDEMIADTQADREERQSKNLKLKYAHRLDKDSIWQYDHKISRLGAFNCLKPIIPLLYEKCNELRFNEIDYKKYRFLINSDGETFTLIK